MTGLLKTLTVKFLKGHWGRLVPAVFKAAGEGDFGPQIKAVYWFGEKYVTVTGAVLWGVGTALETTCSQYPQWPWTCSATGWVILAGQILAAAGLLRGATNSPWPEGAQKGQKADAKELKE